MNSLLESALVFLTAVSHRSSKSSLIYRPIRFPLLFSKFTPSRWNDSHLNRCYSKHFPFSGAYFSLLWGKGNTLETSQKPRTALPGGVFRRYPAAAGIPPLSRFLFRSSETPGNRRSSRVLFLRLPQLHPGELFFVFLHELLLVVLFCFLDGANRI